MAEYTIDELAYTAGSNTRNVRAYQAKKLLPPPQRVGRANVYTEVHLARLRTIGKLLDRGYTLGNIAEMIAAFDKGEGMSDIIGLESALARPFSNELPSYITLEELSAMFPSADPIIIQHAIKLGMLRPDNDRFLVPSPRMLNVGAELVKAGISLPTVLSQITQLRADVERIAERFVTLIVDEIFNVYGEDKLPPQSEMPRLAEFINRVRPMAQTVVDAELSRALESSIQTALGDRLARIAGAAEQRRQRPEN